jgi:hypothetical protein
MKISTVSVKDDAFTLAKAYGIYIDGKPNDEMVAQLVLLLPRKVTLPCGNFRWFSDLHYRMLQDIPCDCGAPYEHYFIKWKGRRSVCPV